MKSEEVTIRSTGSFYVDNPKRLLALYILSFGTHSLLWTYRHWRHYKRLALVSSPISPERKNDAQIKPFWSAIFGQFYIIGEANRIKKRLGELELEDNVPRPWIIFVLFSILPSLTGAAQATESLPLNLFITLLTISLVAISSLPVLILQKHANLVVTQETRKSISYSSLNTWDWIFLCFGAIVLVLTIVFTIIPPSLLE